jgi:hypothetical protein
MTVTVTEEVMTLTQEIVETITVTVAEQGPPGAPGAPGVLAPDGIDRISGGAPNTDFSTGYIFEGGTP